MYSLSDQKKYNNHQSLIVINLGKVYSIVIRYMNIDF